jgi:hypothetical protein
VVAGFGEQLSSEQTRWRQLNRALTALAGRRVVGHPELSAIAFLFDVEPERGLSDRGVYLRPQTLVHWLRNPRAARPLADDFNWSASEAELVDDLAA